MQDKTLTEPEEPAENAALMLVPAVRQEQILAPQLRASLRVLQMDWQSLVGEIRHEAEVNPVVEVEEPESETTVTEEIRAEEHLEDSQSEAVPDDDSNPSVSIDEDVVERRQRFFDKQVAVESLQEHLIAQIGAADFSGEERQLAELIVGEIDDDGRYVGSLDDLASVVGASEECLLAVLKRVQNFDPPGVGGRNLRECLEIQIRQQAIAPEIRALLLRIVREHLLTVAKRETGALAFALGVSDETCRTALGVLRSLEPKPGRPFVANGRHPQFIHPELEITVSGDELTLVSCENDLPAVTISPFYRDMLFDAATPQETRDYLRERVNAAEQLQDAIHRRGETILKVAEAVFRTQHCFFEKGFGSLKPLTIEEVAKRTGYHGTTVGRAVRGKYVRTPRGVFELRRFFCVGHVGGTGDSVSAVSVKCRISELVKAETDIAMTDDDFVKELAKSGLTISRRTVAKYRAELGIPTAAERLKRRKFQ